MLWICRGEKAKCIFGFIKKLFYRGPLLSFFKAVIFFQEGGII